MSKAKLPIEFTDADGSFLRIESNPGTSSLFFSVGAGGMFVEADAVKALRKSLKAWLRDVGKIEPKPPSLGNGLTVALTFDSKEMHTVLAVTLQDADGRVVHTIWER